MEAPAFAFCGPAAGTGLLRAPVAAGAPASCPGATRPKSDASTSAVVGLVLGAAGVATSRSRARRVGAGRAASVASLKAAGAAPVASAEVVDVEEAKPERSAVKVPLACPVCQNELEPQSGETLYCDTCDLVFGKGEDASFQDLTIEAAKTPQEMQSQGQFDSTTEKSEQGFLQQLPFVETTDAIAKSLGLPQSTEVEALARDVIREGGLFRSRGQQLSVSTFQSPAVTFAYERGWRQSFASSGFPGPDEEFELAQGFLAETSKDGQGTLLDASCGSGLFSRRFAASGAYKAVVALDYSASMLRQVDDFSRKEFGDDYSSSTEAGGKSLSLVRADIGRLPFATCSLDGVHASAAIHCWPAPDNAVAEIARVLKPGGVLVMSTFMPRSPLNVANRGNGGAYTFWTQEDLRSITRRCGFVDFEAVEREPAFIMVRVRKPAAK